VGTHLSVRAITADLNEGWLGTIEVVGSEGEVMDEELKRYLDGMAANIATAMQEMEARIIAAINAPHAQLDAMASRKLEGKQDEGNSDMERIQAGH
jgi:hypothetical protein